MCQTKRIVFIADIVMKGCLFPRRGVFHVACSRQVSVALSGKCYHFFYEYLHRHGGGEIVIHLIFAKILPYFFNILCFVMQYIL